MLIMVKSVEVKKITKIKKRPVQIQLNLVITKIQPLFLETQFKFKARNIII